MKADIVTTDLKSEMKEALVFFNNIFDEKSKNNETDRGYYACAALALDKRVQQKPTDRSQNPTDWHIMCCPTCGRVFWNSGEFIHYQPHYCENCGQAIDWSKKDD